MKKIPAAFEIIGSREKAVAIAEFHAGRKRAAQLIMQQHRNVKSVLEKASPRLGVHRVRRYKWVAGSRNTEVVHKESGCLFAIDPRKVYFSPRESTERLRIAQMVKNNEDVMVFFAGAGPFAIVIAKKSEPRSVAGIEINPDAVEYFKKNVILNKLNNVAAIHGSVKREAKKFYGKCDRILMPLPEKAVDYAEDAMKCAKKGGTVHLYCFSEEGEINKAKARIRKQARLLNKKIRFCGVQRVLPYGPRIWKYRIDFAVM